MTGPPTRTATGGRQASRQKVQATQATVLCVDAVQNQGHTHF